MILPSSDLHLPQLLPGSGAQCSPGPPPEPPGPPGVDTLVTPRLRSADNSALSRLKQKTLHEKLDYTDIDLMWLNII